MVALRMPNYPDPPSPTSPRPWTTHPLMYQRLPRSSIPSQPYQRLGSTFTAAKESPSKAFFVENPQFPHTCNGAKPHVDAAVGLHGPIGSPGNQTLPTQEEARSELKGHK